jgi:hypothetical protein
MARVRSNRRENEETIAMVMPLLVTFHISLIVIYLVDIKTGSCVVHNVIQVELAGIATTPIFLLRTSDDLLDKQLIDLAESIRP